MRLAFATVSNGMPDAFDQLDQHIAIALQINGRASWRAIARGLDAPERTVTRRGQAMLDSGLVKVSTYLDTTRVGEARPLIVVAHTRPGASFQIGLAIAGRPDASSVSVLEGTGQLVCMLLPSDAEARYRLLLHELPSLDGLRDTSVATVLRYFRAGYDWSAGGLPAEAMKELQTLPTSDPERTDPVELSREDQALIAELALDGRRSIASLAEALEVGTQSVQRRLNRLLEEGVIHIRTEVRPKLLGLDVEVLVWIRVPPLEIGTVGRSLATHPAVRFCAATTGPTQILIDCLFADENQLYDFLTNYLGEHGASEIANVAVVVAAIRRGPLVVTD
jgi:DNA-binding Lrp family transcriptional regulator